MCVIAIAVKNEIALTDLLACERANPHGGGVAWVENDNVHWVKNITAKECYALVKDKPFPHIYHFRIASVGAVMGGLCHPFPIRKEDQLALTGNAKSVLFHNGTVGEYKYMAQIAGVKIGKVHSDTLVVSRIVRLRGPDFLEKTSGKWVILTHTGSIQLFGGFATHNGALYSNTFWTHSLREAERMHFSFQNGCSATVIRRANPQDWHKKYSNRVQAEIPLVDVDEIPMDDVDSGVSGVSGNHE